MRTPDTTSQLVKDLLSVYTELLIPFMKVRRDMPFPTEPERQETDGEHAFTLAMLAITVAQRLDPTLDTGLIAKYALVHDLVEAYAGDVSVRADEAAHAAKAANEHAAYLQIKNTFSRSAPWIVDCIEHYEARADREAKLCTLPTNVWAPSPVWLMRVRPGPLTIPSPMAAASTPVLSVCVPRPPHIPTYYPCSRPSTTTSTTSGPHISRNTVSLMHKAKGNHGKPGTIS